MRKVLIPVDGSPNSDRAVKHVIALSRACQALDILLLNVQEPVDSWEVRSFLKPAEIEAMEETKGGDVMQSARALLDDAGVAYVPSVLIGPVADVIARYAREQGCDTIVMGTRGLGAIEGLVLGSVATKVIHLANMPVTLVK